MRHVSNDPNGILRLLVSNQVLDREMTHGGHMPCNNLRPKAHLVARTTGNRVCARMQA